MDRPRPKVPHEHGHVLTEPPLSEWPSILSCNRDDASRWEFHIADTPVDRFRVQARAEAIACAVEFSERLGVSADAPDLTSIVMTGHQPEFYHPGVWIKNFVMERIARTTGSLAVNLVVDTDAFEGIEIATPCAVPSLRKCRHQLMGGERQGWYALAGIPTADCVDEFISRVDDSLATLQAPTVRENFSRFSSAFRDAAAEADNVAELMTIARRRFEAEVPSTYLELPVTHLAATPSFVTFALDIARNARRFASAYNTELQAYRTASKTRDRTQPFPDLAVTEDAVELPFWLLKDGNRQTARILSSPDGIMMAADDEPLARLDDAFVLPGDVILAPKALTLTLYSRMFLADLLIHGVGGGRYDRVTTGVGRRYYGVAPTTFVVASTTMHLPLGQVESVREELTEARGDLRRLEFNPDEFVAAITFDDPAQKSKATALAAQKAELKLAVSEPDVDRRALGSRIKEVNAELAALLEGYACALRSRIAQLETAEAELEILNDRTYPFCLWDPAQVAAVI
ncbi:MAG: hypothetical protein ACYC6C_04600 [Coriobacteriia bacterium]